MIFSIILSVLGAAVIAAAALISTQASDRAGHAAVRALEAHLSGIVPQAMAQAHGFLIDRHTDAGVACASCHGEAAFTEPVSEATCTGCHGTYADLAAITPWEPNPHQSHMGELQCSTCHNVHKASVSFCDECHSFGMQVP